MHSIIISITKTLMVSVRSSSQNYTHSSFANSIGPSLGWTQTLLPKETHWHLKGAAWHITLHKDNYAMNLVYHLFSYCFIIMKFTVTIQY